MKDSKVRIGFVGVGFMGQLAHLRNYAALPDCEVVALAELRPELARKVAAAYGVPKVYAEAADMLAKETGVKVVSLNPLESAGGYIAALGASTKALIDALR